MSNIQGDRLPMYGSSGGYSTGAGTLGSSANSSGGSQNMRKLYIRNLHFKVESNDLKSEFSKYGGIIKCDVPGDPANPGKCKGFAFVEFESENSARDALQSMNNQPFMGRPIAISFADNKERSSSSYPPRSYDNNGGGQRGGYGQGNNYSGGSSSRPPYSSSNDYQRRDYGGPSSSGNGASTGYGSRDNNGGARDDSRQPYNGGFQRQGSNTSYDNRDRRDGYKSGTSSGYDRPRDDRSDRRPPMGLNDKADMIESISSQRDAKKDSTKFDQTPPLTAQNSSVNLGVTAAPIIPEIPITPTSSSVIQAAKDTYSAGFIKPLAGVNPVTDLTMGQIQAVGSAPVTSNIDSIAKPTQQSNYGGSTSNSQIRESGSSSYRPRGDYQGGSSYGGKPAYDNRNGIERSRSRDRDNNNGGGYQKRPYEGGFNNRGGSYNQDRPHYQRDGNNHRGGYDNRGGRDFRRNDDDRHGGNNYHDRRGGGSPSNRGGNDRPFYQRRDNQADRRSGSRERPHFNRENSRGGFGGRDNFRGRDGGNFRGGYDGGNFRGGDRSGGNFQILRGGSRGGRGGFGGGGFRGGRGGRGREDDDVPSHHTFDANKVAQASAQFAATYGQGYGAPTGGYPSGGYQQPSQQFGGSDNHGGSYAQSYGGNDYAPNSYYQPGQNKTGDSSNHLR